jgi:sporulation protein YqfC
MHRETPWYADAAAALLSRISRSIPNAAALSDNLRFVTAFTSEDSMRVRSRTSPRNHKLKEKEVPPVKRNGNWMQRLTETMDLPAEPVPGIPLVEISGENRVLIEHHQGVVGYGKDKICVRVKYGQVIIEGRCLEIVRMRVNQLVISGSICSVTLARKEHP